MKRYLPIITLPLLVLTGCGGTTTTSGPTTTTAPWTSEQSAYVELTTYEAAQQVTLAVIRQPSLPAKDVAIIQASEATTTAGILSSVQAYTLGGNTTSQVLSGIAGAASGAASSIQQVLTATSSVSVSVDTTKIAEAAGISALGSLPLVLVAIEKVHGGYQPTSEDFAAIANTVKAEDLVIQAVGSK